MIQSVWKNLTGLQKAAEHLWCDFKWDTNSSPNTNDFWQYSVHLCVYGCINYIHDTFMKAMKYCRKKYGEW